MFTSKEINYALEMNDMKLLTQISKENPSLLSEYRTEKGDNFLHVLIEKNRTEEVLLFIKPFKELLMERGYLWQDSITLRC